jgi:hypothetical protein
MLLHFPKSGGRRRPQGGDLGHGAAQALGIPRGPELRNLQDSGNPDQQRRVLDQLFFSEDERQKLFLHIGRQERARLRLEPAAHNFRLVGAPTVDIAEGGHHGGCFCAGRD